MSNKVKAILLMVLSAMSFSLMQVFVAFTADGIPLFEQLFFRNAGATLLAVFAIKKQQLSFWGQKKNRLLLLGRALFGYLGMITTFAAVGKGTLGDVATILQMSPFVVTVLAALFLKEKITRYQILALCVALSGVFFVANPQFNSDLKPVIIASFACLFAGTAYTFLGALKGKERPEVIIFVFSMLSTIATLPLMLANLVLPTVVEGLMLVCIGTFAGVGQICLTYSYSYAKASEVSVYNYSGIIFATIFGFVFLQQSIKPTSLIGAVLVIVAGYIVFWNSKEENRRT